MKKLTLAIITGTLFLTLTACNPNTPAPTDSPQESTPAGSTPEPTPPAEPTPTPEEDKVTGIGEAVTLGDWGITVTGMQAADSIKSSQYTAFTPDDGNKYIQVFVTVSNNGKTADTFLPSYGLNNDVRAKLLYGDGYEFSSTNLLGYDNDLHNTHLNPLSSVDKEIAFSVPESVTSSEDELLISFTSGKDSVVFKIR